MPGLVFGSGGGGVSFVFPTGGADGGGDGMVTAGSVFGFSRLTAVTGFLGGSAVLFSSTVAAGTASAGFEAVTGGVIFDFALELAAMTLMDFGFVGAAEVLRDLRGLGCAGTTGGDGSESATGLEGG
ncbi:MAG: hypothetical protein ACXW3Z_16425, partial [Limisphaerales bacterium]